MLFSVARLRLQVLLVISVILSLASSIQAREESLFTSSVTYCAPPESLLIQQFDVAYLAKNQSISFNISAASVEPNVNVSANLLLNVYGMHPVNFTIDLCSILHGALCPLPMYNFTGSDSIALPSSLGVSGKIPGVAFKIPDLEAFAQLKLVDVRTGVVKACVQSTLSNGWSMRQTAVEWTIGVVAVMALVSAILQSLSPDALAPYRILELLYLFQSIAVTGLLNLNYPSVYRAFTLNFAWALGLISPVSSSLQSSINNMRHLTGGNMANATSGAAVGLVNRKLSPYNVPIKARAFDVPPLLMARARMLPKIALGLGPLPVDNSAFSQKAPSLAVSGTTGTPQTVTTASANVLEAGVPIYVNSIGIATANAFMTVFFVTLILAAIAMAVFVIGYGYLRLVKRKKWGKQGAVEAAAVYQALVRAWSLRLLLGILPPVLTFAIYQWTLKDSWLAILLAVLTFIGILAGVLYPAILTIRIAVRSTPYSLYPQTLHLSTLAPLYAQYRIPRYYFFLPLLVASFARALCVALARSHGDVQIYLMIVIEFSVLVALMALLPYKSKGGNVLPIYLSIIRLVCTSLMVAFLERFSLTAIPRVIIGIVIAVLFSVTVIVMFINHVVLSFTWLRSVQSSTSTTTTIQSSADDGILEKGELSPHSVASSMDPFTEPRPAHVQTLHSANPTSSFARPHSHSPSHQYAPSFEPKDISPSPISLPDLAYAHRPSSPVGHPGPSQP